MPPDSPTPQSGPDLAELNNMLALYTTMGDMKVTAAVLVTKVSKQEKELETLWIQHKEQGELITKVRIEAAKQAAKWAAIAGTVPLVINFLLTFFGK